MRRIELDQNRQCLIISFPYHPSLVEVVRGLPERRFDRAERTWSVPSEHASVVVATLESHGFLRSPEVDALVAGKEPGAAVVPGDSLQEAEGPPTLRISQLNMQVRRAVVSAFPQPIWVVGEIAGYDRNQQRRHAYFELVEKTEATETPRARVQAVLFEQTRKRVDLACQNAPEPFQLTDGIEVRFRVRIDLYEASGSYQIIVEDVDPVHTLGRLALARRELLRELTERGLRDRNHQLALAPMPLRVALITSWGSDAFNDVVKEFEQSGYAFTLTVFDARMQGQALKETVAAGLDYFARTAVDHDVLVVAARRGLPVGSGLVRRSRSGVPGGAASRSRSCAGSVTSATRACWIASPPRSRRPRRPRSGWWARSRLRSPTWRIGSSRLRRPPAALYWWREHTGGSEVAV